MIAWAAIDLRRGAAVQLVGGRPEAERVRRPDPVAAARAWLDAGFRHLHVIDLDAALGTGDNRAAVATILATADAVTQVGGGVREIEDIERRLAIGADRVIVGTRAVEDRTWLERACAAAPDRLVVAADVRDGRIVTRGWTRELPLEGETCIASLDELPLAAVLVTDVSREGRMAGTDDALFARLAAAGRHPLIAAGGVRDLDDLRAIARAGAAGAVLGMALYTGALDARTVALEFAA